MLSSVERDLFDGMKAEQARQGPPPGYEQLPMVPGGRYTDPAFLELEMKYLWRKSWLYALHSDELPRPGSFRLWRKTGAPIIIVRGKDEKIRAFYNTCRHRGAPLLETDQGETKGFFCRYHGWTYDLGGRLTMVREKRDFPNLDMDCMGLVEVRCEMFGNWVFVNEDPNAKPLLDSLGPIPQHWENLGIDSMRHVGSASFEIACNIKILLDAFFETYHLKSIHPQTVDRFLDSRGTCVRLWKDGNSMMCTPHRRPDWKDPGAIGMLAVETAETIFATQNPSYNLYPNLITPPCPTGIPFLTFWPKTHRTMTVDVHWAAPDGSQGHELWPTRMSNFARILEEDTQFAPRIQESVETAGFKGMFVSYAERRMYHWHEELDRRIGIERVPPELRGRHGSAAKSWPSDAMATESKATGAPQASPSYQSYLARDSRPVPATLRQEARRDLGTAGFAADRYTAQEFFDLEAKRMWTRVWQMACRVEDIPNVGDAHVYDIVGKSFIVVRTAPGRIQAFYNSCTHRGRKLLTADGHVEQFRCGFHGFAWTLDGKVKFVPCKWDFQHVSDAEWRLPEVRVDTWGGFVFLNMDPNAMPLAEYLGPLPEHFARWQLEDCYKAVHVAKVIRCNWKIAQEAFMESYHVIATHPQILSLIADANSQYDVLGDHVNRNMAAFGAPSPHLGGAERVPAAQTLGDMLKMWGRRDAEELIAREAGHEPRAVLGELTRQSFAKAYGGSYDQASDAEVLDALVYNVFPNFSPWGGFAPNIVYRWRPHGRDPGACVMEVMILKRVAPGARKPAAAPVHWLAADEPWAAATELPILGAVIDQDMENMPCVQEGLVASGTGIVQLGGYQESRIRHMHQTLDRYLARE